MLKFKNRSFNVSSIVFSYVFSMLSLGCVVISDLFHRSLHAFAIRYDSTYLASSFFTLKVFLHWIAIYVCIYICNVLAAFTFLQAYYL